ncbi:MAG: hypothetical protein R3B81_09535 [bacterium]
MSRRLRSLAALAGLALLHATPALAADAQKIFEKALAEYEGRLASIQNVTIVQETMGMETTTRLEKKMVDGHPVLVAADGPEGVNPGSFYTKLQQFAERAKLRGSEKVDGNACHVLTIDHLEDVSFDAEGSEDFEPGSGTFYVDEKDYVLRRVEMTGTAKMNGNARPVTMDMHLQDYRNVKGWLQPFQTTMKLAGEGGQDSPEIAQMKEAMAQMKEELAKMPPEQREMMEKMMASRMPNLEQMAEGDGLTVTVTVKEVRVNE